MCNMSGWIKLHRQLQENPIWYAEPFTRGQAWVELLMDANHDENSFIVRGNTVVVPRGFIGKSEDTFARKWKWSRGKVRRFIKYLETVQQVVHHKNPVLSLIEVVNYNQYQFDSTTYGTTDGTTERQQTVQQTDTNKNVKNVKNDKNTYVARSETKALYDSIENLCSRYGLQSKLNIKGLDILVGRYIGKIRMGVEAQHCISWLLSNNLRVVTTQRIGNWFKKAQEIQKRDALKQLEWKEAKNNPSFAQKLKEQEIETSVTHFTQSQ